MTASIVDSRELTGNISTLLQAVVPVIQAQIRTALVQAPDLRAEQVPDYPITALRELLFNAVAHRNYETSNMPVRVHWFSDRVEIQNPGGLYGAVTVGNFGQVSDYRNPVLAEAMKVFGYVERFGVGVGRAKAALLRNGNPLPQWTFEGTHSLVVVRGRSA